MKHSRINLLLEYLLNNIGNWTSARILANVLGVSDRQVRNYVKEINQEFTVIKSSNAGYQIDQDQHFKFRENRSTLRAYTPEKRAMYILQKIISFKEGYDIFDLSEEQFVSVPTIESDLNTVKDMIEGFELSITRHKNLIVLLGQENKKRELMNTMISNESYDNFVLKDEIQLLTFHYHFGDFRKQIKEIFDENNFYTNDYTLNNVALHLIIMIDRIRNHYELKEEVNLNHFMGTQQYKVAQEICSFVYKDYEITVSHPELFNLLLIIENNTTLIDYKKIDSENMLQFVDKRYIDITRQVISGVEERYYLETFNDDFFNMFTLHIQNLFNRLDNNYKINNPLTHKIKRSYPLIYDIAVYIGQELQTKFKCDISEDEIAYISFHIGSYFENNVQKKDKLKAVFIYADYYNMHETLLEKLKLIYGDRIHFKNIVSINDYDSCDLSEIDFVLSTVEFPIAKAHLIITPFLNDKDIRNIFDFIDKTSKRNFNVTINKGLLNIFDDGLYLKNPEVTTKTQLIRMMSQTIINKNYASNSFTDDVIERERISSTRFGNVAVPHSISNHTTRSFVSVATFDSPLMWDEEEVFIVLLIGIHNSSRKLFSDIFDDLIDVVSEANNVITLSKSGDYKEFMETITAMMIN